MFRNLVPRWACEDRLESRKGESAQEARLRLLRLLEEGATGCVSGIRGTVEYKIYLMNGDLLAAHAESDTRRVVEILRNLRLVGAPEMSNLQKHLANGESLSDLLMTLVSDDRLSKVLFDRFRENVFEFTSFASNIQFEPMEAIFVDNIQVGHDSLALLAELDGLRERLAAADLEPEQVFRRGRTPANPGDEQALVDTFRDQITVEELLRRSPFERSRTLSLLLEMVNRGALIDATPPANRGEALPEVESPDRRPTPVQRSASKVPVPLPLAAPSLPAMNPEEDAPTSPGFQGKKLNPVPIPPTDTPVVDEEMAAFQDYDGSRTGGLFSAERQHLERLELTPVTASTPPQTFGLDDPPTNPGGESKRIVDPIELEDAENAGKDVLKTAVSLSFTGRRLDDGEMKRKIEVVNEVLSTIVAALNNAQSGSGNAQLQLLLEGAPAGFAPLFKGVEARPGGLLPEEAILRNLRRRPPSEQRQLFNQGLSDLVERALSVASDGLSDEDLEKTLEQIAGYQQKFGL